MRVEYLGHDGLSVLILDISEGHLCALMLVDLQLRVIRIRNFLQRHYATISDFYRGESALCGFEALTLLLDDHPRHTHSRIRCHLHRAETSSGKPLLPQLGSPIYL